MANEEYLPERRYASLSELAGAGQINYSRGIDRDTIGVLQRMLIEKGSGIKVSPPSAFNLSNSGGAYHLQPYRALDSFIIERHYHEDKSGNIHFSVALEKRFAEFVMDPYGGDRNPTRKKLRTTVEIDNQKP